MEQATAGPLTTARPEWVAWSVLVVGVLAASGSAILIRYAAAEPLAISFWRCALGAAALAPFSRPSRIRAARSGAKAAAVAGAFLAVHFASWISSLELTTVAESVLLVSTTPIFVALTALLLWKEKLPAVGWIGIAIAMAGASIIGIGSNEGESSLTGNALALAGGAASAGYYLAGRAALASLGIIDYASLAYAGAAAFLLPACLVMGAPLWGYPAETWWWLVALVIGPQLLGHTLINFVLTDIHPTVVSVTIMVEPVIAGGLAYFLFSEVPSWLVVPGGAAILAGIFLVAVTRDRPVPTLE